jgi:Phage portal protein
MGKVHYFDGLKSSLLVDTSNSEWQWTPLPLKAEADAGIAPADAYLSVGDIYRGVQIRANAVAKMPKHFYDLKGGDEIELGDPKLSILGKFTDTLWRIESSLLFYGASYLAKLDANTNALRWFNSATIFPKWLPDKGLIGFSRGAPGQNFFGLDAMAYIWYPSPFTELGPGPGAARVAMEEAGVVRGVNRALSAYFERGMIQPVLIYSDAPLSPDQKSDLKTWFNRMFGGVRRAFSLEIATRKLEKLDLSSSLKDAYPPGIRDEMCKSIAKTLGIPFSMLFSDAANYATAVQDEKNFYEQSVNPDCELIQEALNDQVFNYFGFELYFAPDELPYMQVNTTTKATGLKNLIDAGMPIDVALDGMGYDLDEEDDARVRLISLMKEGATYDAARVYILAGADPNEIERVTAVLDLFKPVSVKPTTPIEQMYTAPQLPQPAQAPVTPPATPAVPPAKADLARWQVKAMKRLKSGKPAACEFESEHISPALSGAISGSLESCETADDVKRAFNGAQIWEKYP